MRKSDRLFQLTNILRAHQPITAKSMAERLSVSERTIYRYIDDLSLSGIPVYGEPGIGYRLSDGYELPPLQLSASELEALVCGVSFVSALTDNRLSASAHSLLSKVEAALPPKNPPLKEECRSIRVPGSMSRAQERDAWGRLHAAIGSRHWLNITYQTEAEIITTRTIFPLGLFYWGGKWTVGSWCSLRNSYRDFRIDRIENLTKDHNHHELPEHVSLQAYMAAQEEK